MSMALTTLTKKPAYFSAIATGRQYIPVCFHYHPDFSIQGSELTDQFVKLCGRVPHFERPHDYLASGTAYRYHAFVLGNVNPNGCNYLVLHRRTSNEKFATGDRPGSLPIQLA